MKNLLIVLFLAFLCFGSEPDECDAVQIENGLCLNLDENGQWVASQACSAVINALSTSAVDAHDSASSLPAVEETQFIILNVNSTGFGGWFFYVLVKGCLHQVVRLWLYEVDEDKYQIRESEKLRIVNSDSIMSRFDDAAFNALGCN